jgi:hypothetical protein
MEFYWLKSYCEITSAELVKVRFLNVELRPAFILAMVVLIKPLLL